MLTVEHAEKNNFNLIDCCKFFDASLTNDECEFIIWEHTCFPIGDKHKIIKQLNEYFDAKTKF